MQRTLSMKTAQINHSMTPIKAQLKNGASIISLDDSGYLKILSQGYIFFTERSLMRPSEKARFHWIADCFISIEMNDSLA